MADIRRIASALNRLVIEMKEVGMEPPVAIVLTPLAKNRMLAIADMSGSVKYDAKKATDTLAGIPILRGTIESLQRRGVN